MKLRSYSIAVVAGSLLASAAFAQNTPTSAAQPTMKPAVAGETAKIETKATTKAAPAKSDTTAAAKQASDGSAKMTTKHKHPATETAAKPAGASATMPEAKHEMTKETSGTTKPTAKEPVKAGAGPSTSTK